MPDEPLRPGRHDPVYRACVQILKYDELGHQIGCASGFNYSGRSGAGYVITNRHVVTKNNPAVIVARSIVNERDLMFTSFAYRLHGDDGPRWLEKAGGPDVVAIPFSANDEDLTISFQDCFGENDSEPGKREATVQSFVASMVAPPDYLMRLGDGPGMLRRGDPCQTSTDLGHERGGAIGWRHAEA